MRSLAAKMERLVGKHFITMGRAGYKIAVRIKAMGYRKRNIVR